jgi:hypothetical protein
MTAGCSSIGLPSSKGAYQTVIATLGRFEPGETLLFALDQ